MKFTLNIKTAMLEQRGRVMPSLFVMTKLVYRVRGLANCVFCACSWMLAMWT